MKSKHFTEDELPELPEDTYYIRDLIGMRVVTEDGAVLGTLSDVLQNTAQDVYEVQRAGEKPLLIPGVAAFIRQVDPAERTITVRLPEGLLEL